MVCEDETGSSRIEMAEAGSISGMGCVENNTDDDLASQWAAVERMHTFERVGSSLVDENDGRKDDLQRKQAVDITKLGDIERQCFIDKLTKHIEHDNLCLLQKVRERIDKTGVRLPTVEVRYNNLTVEAECEVVHGKPLPTLWNTLKNIFSDFTNLPGLQSQKAKITLVDDVCGIIKPGCMTLLLGPPGCGKTTLLKALSGNVNSSLKVSGEVSYNGYKLEDFIPQKTSAYISQNDVHVPEMTVRETLDFSARCQGVGSRAELMAEVIKSEKQAGIFPDPDIDTYMKAISIEGRRTTLQTDYIMKILGIDICADTLYGDAMRRGISGGQKKRLTTGEMIVGPKNALFMDEISNGLDSSTAYKIVTCLQQLVHITDATALVALLQPSPETFQLFDDIILMGEGKILYHGPRSNVLEFFDDCGFRCPSRKGIADFLQEVISRKDQAQYWHRSLQSYSYVSVDMFSKKFKESPIGKNQNKELKNPFVKSEIHKKAISFNLYSLPKWTMLRACMSREILLMRRNSSLYICKSVQLFVIACITTTVFLRTRMDVDAIHANDYMGALFYGLTKFFFDGFMELSGTVRRLEVFYKQRELYFYPAWAYAIPASILKFPILLVQAIIWTSVTYYGIGYSPEAARFFRQVFVFFAVNVAATSMFRFLASVFRTMVTSTIASSVVTLLLLLCSGFILPEPSIPGWLKWLYWISPVSYGEIGLALNEFLAPRWQKPVAVNTTVGKETLKSRGLDFNADFYWLSLGALFGLAIVFNIGFILALTYLNPPVSRAMISKDRLSQIQGTEDLLDDPLSSPETNNKILRGKVVLPFQPLTLVFQDVQYYIETPRGMRERGFTQKKLQLLCDVSGVFMPGVLTALMGVSGAGKTTLLDVLSGRKTSGTIEGNIRIGGYPKVQETFVRISGYCEQTDIHSPQITVEESVIYSAWLRLLPEIDSKTKFEFVKEVLEIIEMDEIKDCLVGMAGVSGLSTEQRKRLTIAVELVANPSIIFMDEPTTGLDARAAAIAMRAVKNVADTGRTIVCTIHQPSIDIFEAFDELILLKDGGHVIYSGPLGQHSSSVIDYFQALSGVPKFQDNYNPGTWILEVTSPSAEAKLGIDFAQVYQSSSLYQDNKVIAHRLSIPPPGSRELYFGSRYSQNGWGQFKSCLWKQNLSYWRSPSYNLMRTLFMLVTSLFFGILLWDQGKDINKQQDLFNVIGATFVAVLFIAINNSSSAIPYIFTERTIFYRERFAGMYGPWAYAFSQVIIEVPYLLAQAVIFVAITYPMIGYHWSAFKFFWYFHAILCTMVYFTYLGMLVVSIAPSFAVAMILQSAMYTVLNLFSGFLIPQPEIPKWWLWMYYLTPTSWTLKAIITSQYGDRDSEIVAFGETKTLSAFLKDYFGYHRDQLPVAGVVLFLFPVVFASLFAFFIGKLNFQRR